MKGGVDAADTCWIKTDKEMFAKAMGNFKCNVNVKAYDPFKEDAKWIYWWSHFRITLSSQGLSPVLDVTCMPDETQEGIGFARMQATVFSILKTQVQAHTGRAIIRNHQDSLDTRAAITEPIACHRNSTRASAMGHTLHQELLTMRLTKDVRMSRHEFLHRYGSTMCDYLEHTHRCAEAQMSQNQLLIYLQEAVSLEPVLN